MPLKQVSNQLVTISVILSAPGTAAATSTSTTPTSSTTAATTTSALAVSKTFFQSYFSVRVLCQKFSIRSRRRRRPSPPPSSLRVNTKLRHQFFLSLSIPHQLLSQTLSPSYRRFPSKTNAGSFWFQPKQRLELFRIFLSSECHFFILLSIYFAAICSCVLQLML